MACYYIYHRGYISGGFQFKAGGSGHLGFRSITKKSKDIKEIRKFLESLGHF